MSVNFIPERLTSVRKELGINMAEAARRLNLSKMGYLRYEHGDRTPSFQTIEFLARRLGTSAAYLCGETDDPGPEFILISKSESPVLFDLVMEIQHSSDDTPERLRAFYEKMKEIEKQAQAEENESSENQEEA